MPWEPLRPWGPVSTEGIRLGPLPWLGQLKGLRFCRGRGRGPGRGVGGQRLRGVGCGEGSTSGFLQSCLPVEGLPRCIECRATGALPGVARGGAPSSDHRPIPTFRHFREKLMKASVSRMVSSFSTMLTPLACPERPTEGAQGTGRPAFSVGARV